MKVGFRKPSLKKSIKARTTGKLKRKVKRTINPLYGKKGMGYLKNPKRALKNKIYHKTTFGTNDIIRVVSHAGNSKKTKSSKTYVMNAKNINPLAYFCIVFFLGFFGVHRFIDGSIGTGLLYLFTVGVFGLGWIVDVLNALSLLFRNNKKRISNEDLLQLQKILMPGSTNDIVLSQEELIELSIQQAENDIRIVHESANIVKTTNKPDVYFSRMNLMKQHAEHMLVLEPYVPFNISPSDVLNEITENENESTKEFIVRYFNSVKAYSGTLKTKNSKQNQFDNFYATMQNYQNHISSENKQLVKNLYNHAINSLTADDSDI